MTSNHTVRQLLSLAGACSVFAVVVAILACQRGPVRTAPDLSAAEKEAARSWPLWGGTVQRNLVNLVEKNIATDWSVTKDKEKNILWTVNLGSKAYGGPTFGAGKIFVGTNNNIPRDKEIRGDKGVIMCFRESDGQFLWQIVHNKLDAGRVMDWPEEGICSAPVIEGSR